MSHAGEFWLKRTFWRRGGRQDASPPWEVGTAGRSLLERMGCKAGASQWTQLTNTPRPGGQGQPSGVESC